MLVSGLISQEPEIADHLVVEVSVSPLPAVEEQKRVNEKRQVSNKRNVESAITVDGFLRHPEEIRK